MASSRGGGWSTSRRRLADKAGLRYDSGVKKLSAPLLWLIAGDTATLAAVTVYGFASHHMLTTAGSRIAATFVPLLVGWALAGLALGLYDLARPRPWWQPLWAILFAAPLAGWLRGLWLGTPVVPVFVAVLGGVAGLALLAWRALFFCLLHSQKKAPDG